jgi:DNA polymerase III subunit gamma/tau
VLDKVRDRSRRTRALLDNASIATVEGTVIRLAATSAPIAKMIGDDSNLAVLQAALGDVVGGGWTIEVGVDSGPAAEQPRSNGRPTGSVPPVVQADEADDVDEESDEVSGSRGSGPDPETAAMALLQNGLGARPLENS